MGRNFGMIAFDHACGRNATPAKHVKFCAELWGGETSSLKTRLNDSNLRAARNALFNSRVLEIVSAGQQTPQEETFGKFVSRSSPCRTE
jgi:hypothetical protein